MTTDAPLPVHVLNPLQEAVDAMEKRGDLRTVLRDQTDVSWMITIERIG